MPALFPALCFSSPAPGNTQIPKGGHAVNVARDGRLFSQRAVTNNFNRGNSKLPGWSLVNQRFQNHPNHRGRKQPAMGRQPPATPPRRGERRQQEYQAQPPKADPPTRSSSAVLHILGKRHPLHLRGVAHTAFPAALLEALHPGVFFQAQYAQVATYKSPPKNAPRQLRQGTRLQGANMLSRHLGRRADGLYGHPALFPCPPQFLAECRQSALSRHLSWSLLAPYDMRYVGPKSKEFVSFVPREPA
jgi:hypothetical protein